MKAIPALAMAVLVLSGCAASDGIRITQESTAAAQTKSRLEPVFYNGKTYQLDYHHVAASNTFLMKVSGMTASQRDDAVAVATSSLGHFACLDSQKAMLVGAPSYRKNIWHLRAKCA